MKRQRYRHFFLLLLMVSLLVIVGGYVTADSPVQDRNQIQGTTVAEPRDNWTVFTSQGFAQTGTSSAIVGIAPNGSVGYYNETYHTYLDVDPSPEGEKTVLYVGVDQIDPDDCQSSAVCYRNVIERVNLTTDKTTRIYEEIRPGPTPNDPRWHDVDRLNSSHYLVGDIHRDTVTLINKSSGLVTWEWRAQSHYPIQSGGTYPKRWTHLNDVEILADGRYMASIRNQDEVVFLERDNGVQENWTLGEDDNYSILREQHNPDYIPDEHGGPAVLVADSGNDRIVEYERRNGEWTQSWVYQGLNWPRDADRLPSGNTLIADSNGGRIIEVNESGDIVWSIPTTTPYEVERLGTGPESQGGAAASTLDLKSQTASEGSQRGLVATFRSAVLRLIPGEIKHGISFVTPFWMGFFDVGAVLAAILVLLIWGCFELRWSNLRVRFPVVREE